MSEAGLDQLEGARKGCNPKCSKFGGNAADAQKDISRCVQKRMKKVTQKLVV